jgi:cysteine-rich repeat protein
VAASCGDGFVHAGVEACDDGNADDSDACQSSCQAAFCGDGFVQTGVEVCDDANADNSDACLSTCVAAFCGDGFVQTGVEACDDGNTVTEQCSSGESCLVCDASCHQVVPEPSEALLLVVALATAGALSRRTSSRDGRFPAG